MKKQVEIMAPVGSYGALAAAIRAGAGSVYFGIDRLNMRSRAASPFTVDDLRKIARIARWCGVRSYLALNTLVYDDELELMRALCRAAKEAGVSAVIAADLAVMEYARSVGLEVHVSVQANVANIEAVRFFARYADVVVLARELTLAQIRAICEAVEQESICGPSGKPVQIELFVHGALCVAVSGKCYMSLGVYNQSANRGACFQPCRRRYRVIDAETGDAFEVDNQFIMSPRDLCLVEHLDRILATGVSILKIEGRGRKPDYVGTVTRVYQEAVKAIQEGRYTAERKAGWIEELRSVFNRGFWQGGYYCGEPLGEWSGRGHSQATRARRQIGVVSNFYARPQVAEFELWQPLLRSGDELLIEGPTTGSVRLIADNIQADGQPVDAAHRGAKVTLHTPVKVRRQDKVFLHNLKEEENRGIK